MESFILISNLHTEITAWEWQVRWSRHGSNLRPNQMVAMCAYLKLWCQCEKKLNWKRKIM